MDEFNLRSQPQLQPPPSSVLKTVVYILRQFVELPLTAIFLLYNVILPEARDWITTFGMGKAFDPKTDIGSLEGKIILVTGGMCTIALLSFSL